MSRSIAAGIVLAAILLAGGSSSASACWWFHCDEPVLYEPPPVYVYDHNNGPTWTGNGWAYLPIGAYYPRPPVVVPPPPQAGYRHDFWRRLPRFRDPHPLW